MGIQVVNKRCETCKASLACLTDGVCVDTLSDGRVSVFMRDKNEALNNLGNWICYAPRGCKYVILSDSVREFSKTYIKTLNDS